MTKIIGNSNTRHKPMTRGERRFANRLEKLLEDDYLCWFDIPLGEKRRYTDFIILHPSRGILFLEVKDWSLDNIRKMTVDTFDVLCSTGLKTRPNPILQARQCATHYINRLKKDPVLQQEGESYKGSLLCPWGYGVVLPNVTRRQLNKALVEDTDDTVLPKRLTLCKDEMSASVDAEDFQQCLWDMFTYRFGSQLTLPQIDRFRWHLFPEIRITPAQNLDLFHTEQQPAPTVPDIVQVMDIQQEQLARSLGDGHRVVHGVAGSGKTLILGYRCVYLSQTTSKPILVLCFNKTLARKLKAFIRQKNIAATIQVYHFHDWCKRQLVTYHIDMVRDDDEKVYDAQVKAVINAVDNGLIPREQYGALLIDEGHDFKAEWLSLITQMIDKKSNSLLLLYDDAQAIYQDRGGIDFSLSSVGVQARGRTTILKLNYRNTQEILHFAYRFAVEFLQEKTTDDDHIPLIAPEMAGKSGPEPNIALYRSLEEEIGAVYQHLQAWHKEGVSWHEMAVIFPANWLGKKLHQKLQQKNVPCLQKTDYRPEEDCVALLTRHSSKGLEFSHVVCMGVGTLKDNAEKLAEESRLLYVGMTRAKECLCVTAHQSNEYTKRLLALACH